MVQHCLLKVEASRAQISKAWEMYGYSTFVYCGHLKKLLLPDLKI